MNIEVAMRLTGFLFWFIIVTNIASERFGYITLEDVDPAVKLQRINESTKKFKIGVTFILIEHLGIIALAVMLFIALNTYGLILALIFIISRTGEGLIQIYYKKNYWGLLNVARQYSGTAGSDNNALIEAGRSILKTKSYSFSFAQLLFSVGTLAYLILFISNGVVPVFIGWFGIVATVLYGMGNGIILVKPGSSVLLKVGGLLILLLEIVLGGWLLFDPNIVP